jgi:putative pyruvate formate lyase activating enzyme
MRCVYCQNFSFSQLDEGDETEAAGLADMMLKLEGSGCHNINLVSPTHYVPQILEALEVALAAGLSVPVVYNTGGYELTETLKCLNGVIDIYMPDMRYSSDRMAALYSGATDYVANNRSAVMEMHHQVGDLVLDDEGIAKKGLIIRLLVLPNGISGTIDTLRFIKDNVSEKAYLSVMSQYHPTYRAADFEPISRRITPSEYKNVVDAIAELGLNNGWIQESPDGIDLRFLGNNIRPDRRQMP